MKNYDSVCHEINFWNKEYAKLEKLLADDPTFVWNEWTTVRFLNQWKASHKAQQTHNKPSEKLQRNAIKICTMWFRDFPHRGLLKKFSYAHRRMQRLISLLEANNMKTENYLHTKFSVEDKGSRI